MEIKTSRSAKESESESEQQRALAAQRALRVRQEEAYLANVPIPTEDTIRRIAKWSGFECTLEILEEVEKLQADWEKAAIGISEHTHGSARAEWRKYNEEQLKKADLKDAETFTFEEFQRDFRVKISAYKERQRDCSRKVMELVAPEAQDFYACANSLADELEIAEQQTAEKFGVAYQPSPVVMAIRKAAFVVQQRMKTFTPTSGVSPRVIASFVPFRN
ncbi:MAG TPA: hypothetical protein VN873_05435 [Candidatus Angelobacter sp.]|nr:hypothetical protein [Candidatus Angelobacter sp.]